VGGDRILVVMSNLPIAVMYGVASFTCVCACVAGGGGGGHDSVSDAKCDVVHRVAQLRVSRAGMSCM